MKDILKQEIDQRFADKLPADHIAVNGPRQVLEACYSFVDTKIPSNPKLLHVSTSFLDELKLEIDDEDEFLKVVSGAIPYRSAKSYAMCYGGHQFGNWAGQLGDGRAINIAELNIDSSNWKFQLKGSGPTPYSRGSDGLAVLRSSIREYLCSEAMHYLGIATTRALSLITTGDQVPRDIMYTGDVKDEPGAIVCRVSPSFVRIGSFEIFTSRRDIENLKKLTDHVIQEHYPHLGEPSKETYLNFFQEVVNRTKTMIVHWQRVGFVHGVMNTDNMSILGLTIDYGPYGWLEDYDRSWTPNTTDAQHRRYRYGNQASIALWNLTQLANSLYPLIDEVEPLEKILDGFKTEYLDEYFQMMRSKIGLQKKSNVDDRLIDELKDLLENSSVDMTIFFRNLSQFDNPNAFIDIVRESSYLEADKFDTFIDSWMSWLSGYSERLNVEDRSKEERAEAMNAVNPKYVLRNYMAQLAIEAAEKEDFSLIDELYQLLLRPYDDQPEMGKWFAKRPDWALDKVGCSMLSCSS
ncbi:MAG: YdiU family protein [Crocinitomicaceae bacterium]|nr:YdiU family protein [Flavobacteriales bacterium]NQZ34083.1 YdiU family protein [Crocinitomicaceae bacterium]